jgi:hypothetical protein
MAREKENYREQLAIIREAFPGEEMLNISQVARWLHRSPATVKRMFSFHKEFKTISVAQLASEMLPSGRMTL